ncbi:MAG: type VI secretion system contractile sheath large subunit [Planctomycetota bacterium]
MRYETNFGALMSKPAPAKPTGTFRLAVLGDFSGRASRGEIAVGDELAKRKPHSVDIDNLDDLVERLAPTLSLPIARDGSAVEIELRSMDDFHPDELYDNLEFFEELSTYRRQMDGSAWQKAADKVRAMAEATGKSPKRAPKPRPAGASVPNAKLSDFAKLVGREAATRAEATVDQILESIIGPHIADARDAEQDTLIEAIDEALSDAMRTILHHPEFQATEALWRSVELLVRRVETGGDLQIVLYDVSAEDLAADLASHETLEDTGLYKLLIEQPALDDHAGALSAVLACYQFDESPPHADLLGRLAKLAAAANAPILAGITNDVVRKIDKDDHPMIAEAWDALRALPHSQYLCLCCPRLLLRAPYGAKSDPIDPFDFEEFNTRDGIGSLLFGNGAVLAACLMAISFRQQGNLKGLDLSKTLSLDDMPYHYYADADGDQIALPCTDRMLSERMMTWVVGRGFTPVLAIRGRPEARLGGFHALAGGALAGPWAPATIEEAPPPTPDPEPEPEPDDAIEDADEPELDDADEADVDDATDEAEDDSNDDKPTAADDHDTSNDDADSDDNSEDDELDALLASLESGDEETDDGEGDDDEMDPELAALLADL